MIFQFFVLIVFEIANVISSSNQFWQEFSIQFKANPAASTTHPPTGTFQHSFLFLISEHKFPQLLTLHSSY
jgi:hypothetical protein